MKAAKWRLSFTPEGSTKGRASIAVKKLQQSGWCTLGLDVFQTGEAMSLTLTRRDDHLTFHRSDDSNRIQDILTGLAHIADREFSTIRLICEGRAGMWCSAAAAAAPIEVELASEGAAHLEGTDDELAELMFIPGFQRIGGLTIIRRLIRIN